MVTSRKKTLLIVDDERDITELLSMHFDMSGEYDVTGATDTLDAFTAARNRRFDLILTDFRMGNLTGQDLIELFRSQDANATTPVVVFSAFVDEARRACHGMENVYFLSKPLSTSELETFVRHIISALPAPTLSTRSLNPAEFLVDPLERTARAIYGARKFEAISPGSASSPITCDASTTFAMTIGTHLVQVTLAFNASSLQGLTGRLFGEGSHSREYSEKTALTELATLLFSQIRRAAHDRGFSEPISPRISPVLVLGKVHSINPSPAGEPLFSAEVRTEFGNFHIFLEST